MRESWASSDRWARWRAAGWVARRELLEFVRDRRTLVITLLLPMISYPILALATTLGLRTGVLEAESGFNDAPVVILVVALSTIGPADAWYVLIGTIALELAIGVAIGLAVGFLGAYGLRHVALPASGLYPIAVMAIAIVAYAAGAMACLRWPAASA